MTPRSTAGGIVVLRTGLVGIPEAWLQACEQLPATVIGEQRGTVDERAEPPSAGP